MKAIVLSRRDFREADQIISLYTLEKGKMEILARGIKKITSKNSAHLEPFSLVEAEIIFGKELNYLGAVQ
ncbi:MAG: DNA repair protein RecO, partial [Candidatus Magasanikiibacteriota bacterium]